MYRCSLSYGMQQLEPNTSECWMSLMQEWEREEDVLSQNYTQNLEKREKHPLEKIQKIRGDGAPKLQISVPCRGRACPDFLY